MFCGNGSGEMLPPYVVYKSEHLWPSWTEGGPLGCRYNRTKSGWFDMGTFEDWFMTTLLPQLKKLPGVKVVIGDKLSSHINLDILRACEENNVRFVCVPPNNTPHPTVRCNLLRSYEDRVAEAFDFVEGEKQLNDKLA
jgi:hypothetical protein